MFIRIVIFIGVLVMSCEFSATAQYGSRNKMYEIHVGIGAANVFGDLGGSAGKNNLYGLKDIQFSQTRPTLYLAGRTNINELFSGKVNLFAGMAAGNDAGTFNEQRNYSYEAWMLELSGQIECNFWRPRACLGTLLSQRRGLRGSNLMMTRVYAFAGVGALMALPTLDTHGNRLISGEYTQTSTTTVVIPYGLGVRSDIDRSWAVGFELGRRFTTSDYLDGLSTDWSKANDTYYFTTLHAIYKFQGAGGRRRPGRRSNR